MGIRLTNRLSSSPFAIYSATMCLSLAVLVWVLQLWRADAAVPSNYEKDGLSHLILIKAVADHGWWFYNPSLAAPDEFSMLDFPMSDNGHFLVLKCLCWLTGDPVVAFNLFTWIGFPLIALASVFVLRRFGVSNFVAVGVSLLYAFLPYHLDKFNEHLFLASYYTAPLIVWIVVRVMVGDLPPAECSESGRIATRIRSFLRAIGIPVLVCIAVSASGIYYTMFAVGFLILAALSHLGSTRKWTGAGAAMALAGVLVAGFLANLAPAIRHRMQFGPNPFVSRSPAESNMFALRIADFLVPSPTHRLDWMASEGTRYLQQFGPTVRPDVFVLSSLGLMASLALAWTFVCALRLRDADAAGVQQHALAVLAVAAILIGSAGGLGPLFNFWVSPWVRVYSRLAVFVAFCALAVAALSLSRLNLFCEASGWRPRFARLAFGLLVLLGLYEQSGPKRVPDYERMATAFSADRQFVRSIESELPDNAMVFQLPYWAYPESASIHRSVSYDLARPYIHSRRLHFSFGAAKGRETATLQESISRLSPSQMVEHLVAIGFDAIWIDRFGYADNADALVAALSKIVCESPRCSGDGRWAVLSLQPARRRWKETHTEEEQTRFRQLARGGALSPTAVHRQSPLK